MQNLVLVSGYARSGKTTCLNYLRDTHGFETVSTSEILRNFTSGLSNLFLGHDLDLTDKESYWDIGKQKLSSRELMVEVAENHIVSSFGREAFAIAAAKQTAETKKDVVFEVFNKEEADLFLLNLDISKYCLYVLTLDSPFQEPDVDGRELLYDYFPFANNSALANTQNYHFFKLLDKFVQDLV